MTTDQEVWVRISVSLFFIYFFIIFPFEYTCTAIQKVDI